MLRYLQNRDAVTSLETYHTFKEIPDAYVSDIFSQSDVWSGQCQLSPLKVRSNAKFSQKELIYNFRNAKVQPRGGYKYNFWNT